MYLVAALSASEELTSWNKDYNSVNRPSESGVGHDGIVFGHVFNPTEHLLWYVGAFYYSF